MASHQQITQGTDVKILPFAGRFANKQADKWSPSFWWCDRCRWCVTLSAIIIRSTSHHLQSVPGMRVAWASRHSPFSSPKSARVCVDCGQEEQNQQEVVEDKQLQRTLRSFSIGQRLSRHFTLLQKHSPLEQQRTHDELFCVVLTPKWFVLSWWCVEVFRLCEIAFLMAMTWLYDWLLIEPDIKSATLDQLRFAMSYTTLKGMNWTFTVLYLLNAFELLRCCYYSLRSRQLAFTLHLPKSSSEYINDDTGVTIGADDDSNHGTGCCCSAIACVTSWLVWIKNTYLEPVLFIHGAYFDHFYFVQEFLEIISQVYQAYQMSLYISSRWVNDTYVMMIFLNCVSTPLIHHWVPHSKLPLRRLLSVVTSGFLNLVNSVVIPLIMFGPYAKAFDTNLRRFPDRYMFDDVWYARAVRENQQLLVTSCADYLSTWMLHFSLMSCLSTCQDLLRRKHKFDQSTATTTTSRTSARETNQLQTRQKSGRTKNASKTLSKLSNLTEKWLCRLLCIVGVAVEGIHIVAQNARTTMGCTLQATPWFQTATSCIILNVNCYRRGIDGMEHEIDEILNHINEESLFQLILTHCPKLQIPPSIRQLHHLGGMDIFNCTLDSWRLEASLDQRYHSEMNYLFVFRTNLSSGIPNGMLSKNLPSGLQTIYFYDTNLTTVPTDLHEVWTSLQTLGLEFCRIESFPATLSKIGSVSVTLTGNPMSQQTNSSWLTFNQRLEWIWISNSSLRSLPDDPLAMRNLDNLKQLQLEYTALTNVPKNIRQWFISNNESVAHSLFGSPYCALTVNREKEDASDDEEEEVYRRQVCAQDYGTAQGYFNVYDMTLIEQQRRP